MTTYTPLLVALSALAVLVLLLGALLWSRTREAAPGCPPRAALTPARYETLRWSGISGVALGSVALIACAGRILLDALAVLS